MYLNGKFVNTANPTKLEWCSICMKQPVNISNQACWNHLGATCESITIAEENNDEVPKLEHVAKFDIDLEILYPEASSDEKVDEAKEADEKPSTSVEMVDILSTADGHVILCISANKIVKNKHYGAYQHKSAYAVLKYTSTGTYVALCQLEEGTPKNTCLLPSGKEAVVSYRHGIQFVNILNMTPGKVVKFGSECGGVALSKGMLYIGGRCRIYIVDLIGRLYKTIELELQCVPESICINKDGRMYCSSKNSFYCLTDDGSVVYSYNSSELGKVNAVKVDRRGNIYVAGSELQVFYPYKPKVDRVLLKEDGNEESNAFCFSNDFSKMFIGHNGGKCVDIYTVQNAQ